MCKEARIGRIRAAVSLFWAALVFLHEIVPAALGFQDHFDRFAHRAAAAGATRYVMRRRPQFFAAIGHRHAQARLAAPRPDRASRRR